MIRVAICCRDKVNRTRLRKAVERCARDAHVNNVEARTFPQMAELLVAAERFRSDLLDYAIVCVDGFRSDENETTAATEGMSAAEQAILALKSACPDTRLGLVSSEQQDAMLAYRTGAGFCLLTGTYEQFKAMVVPMLQDAAQQKSAYVSVRTSSGVHNVVLEDVQFVESTKRGPVIHLSEGQAVLARGTLQALYGNLTSWPGESGRMNDVAPSSAPATIGYAKRFIMAGNSFIVNLDNVRSMGEGSLIFADGEAIVVPIRKRKAVQDAWQSFRAR